MDSRVAGGPRGPQRNPEADAYKKYLKDKEWASRGGKTTGPREPSTEDKKWDQWKKDRSEGLSDYMEYKDRKRAPEIEQEHHRQERTKWEQFETDKFGGGLERGKGSGEGGRYTIDDLYIKMSDKQYTDKQRDLMIDPTKKDKKSGGGKKSGSRGTGGKTGGPGNPNTSGGGSGDANI